MTNYAAWQEFADCVYCGTKVLIPADKKAKNDDDFDYRPANNLPAQPFIGIVVFSVFAIIGVSVFLAYVSMPKRKPNGFPSPQPNIRLQSTPSPTPTPDRGILLEFGGKGTGQGLFKDAKELTVAPNGDIYVADDTFRVQRFDAQGKFLNLWTIEANAAKFKRTDGIDKLAADASGKVYVLIGGAIAVYDAATGEKQRVIRDAGVVYDFVLRDDGGILLVSSRGGAEELVQINSSGKTVRRVAGFHSRAAETEIPPHAIRLAVDGASNIFAVYALGDVYGEYSYDDEDLMTFKFTPEGKYVNKFGGEKGMPAAIAVDNQSRVYIATSHDGVRVYNNNGNEIKTVAASPWLTSFALDRENNLYVLTNEKVIKFKSVD